VRVDNEGGGGVQENNSRAIARPARRHSSAVGAIIGAIAGGGKGAASERPSALGLALAAIFKAAMIWNEERHEV